MPGHSPACAGFSCGDDDLDEWLRDDALRLQDGNVVRAFLGYIDEELVGYVALMSDALELETRERKHLALSSSDHPVVPAVKIARLGVSRGSQRRSVGRALVRFAFDVAMVVSRYTGCRLLTVDAYPAAVPFYEGLGFKFNKAKRYRDRDNPSMRFDLHAPQLPGWVEY